MYKDSLYQSPCSITQPSPNKCPLITHSSPKPNLFRNADSPVFLSHCLYGKPNLAWDKCFDLDYPGTLYIQQYIAVNNIHIMGQLKPCHNMTHYMSPGPAFYVDSGSEVRIPIFYLFHLI